MLEVGEDRLRVTSSLGCAWDGGFRYHYGKRICDRYSERL